MPGNFQPPIIKIANSGPSLKLPSVKVSGIAMNAALQDEAVEILQRHGLTSDEYFFHRSASGLASLIENAAAACGHVVDVAGGRMVLVIVKADESAELHLDTVAVHMGARPKRAFEAGMPVFENDLIDTGAMRFPCVELDETDQVIVFFRVGWRYGLYFDLTRELDVPLMEKTLGRLSRTLNFYDKYAALSDPAYFEALISAGWFPFLEMPSDEFASIYGSLKSGNDIEVCGKAILGNFKSERVHGIAERWKSNPHFAKREIILRSGIEAFLRDDPVAAIKTLLSEIEGILQDAHIAAHSTNAKTGGLIQFAVDAGTKKVDDDESLFFPKEFQRYLAENTYGSFDPVAGGVKASRHGVGHGAAAAETYTQVRALQVILTLDQIFFYL